MGQKFYSWHTLHLGLRSLNLCPGCALMTWIMRVQKCTAASAPVINLVLLKSPPQSLCTLQPCASLFPVPLPVPLPLHVGIVNSLFSLDTQGQTYHLAGPQVLTVRELVEFVYSTIREQYHGIYTPSGWCTCTGFSAGTGTAVCSCTMSACM